MRSLFWKGMLAFLVVILVAVGTVALLSGWITEVEFRRYALVHEELWDRQAVDLAAYYAANGTWDGVQDTLQPLQAGDGRGYGRGREGAGPPTFDYRLVDLHRRVVGDTRQSPGGIVSRADLTSAIPIEVEGQVVGYVLPATQARTDLLLDPTQVEFLARVRTSLWIAALAAAVVALVIGGLLFQSIVAPLRRLTAASQAVAEGDLSARAPVRGRDEVAQLGDAFNRMAGSLARAEEARRNQTADVAHELRTPLTVLQGALEAMLDGVYPTNRENLLSGLAQVRTLARLVEDLRVLALADAGQLHLDMASLDLEAFLQEVMEAHQIQAQQRGVALTLDVPAALPPVQADRDRLAQVVGNLLGNALRYVPKGGHISVRAVGQGGEVAVAVADDGTGVPPEDLPRLFERFWRGDRARRRTTGGSGLGLSIARSLVQAHGGRIWAESVEGHGSTFTFTLPVVAES